MNLALHGAFKMTRSLLVRHTLTARDQIVAQMADDMRVLAANTGSASKDELLTLGWTARQIDTHSERARQRALKNAGGVA